MLKASTRKLMGSLGSLRKKFWVAGPATGGKQSFIGGAHTKYVRSYLAATHREKRKEYKNPRRYVQNINYNHGR